MDFPERYGLTRKRLPYPTGILCVATFLVFLPVVRSIASQEIGLMVGLVLLGIVSFIDDRHPLPSWMRLGLQVLVCLVVFATGSRIYTITNPFDVFGIDVIKLDASTIAAGPFGSLPLLSGIFTILWLTLTMNALNWFDGIPGQVTALSAIGFLMLGLLAVTPRVDQPDIALLAFVLMGIVIGAVCFDFPPARVITGDTGAMFFGLMLGILGIYQGGKVATAFLTIGIPLFDALLVIVTRLVNRKSPLRGDKDHLHHRLLASGWSQRRVVLIMCLIGATFGGAALFSSTVEKGLLGIALLLLTALLRRIYRRRADAVH